MTAPVAIPFSAWQQAVFVVMFVVLVWGMLSWFGNQQDKWQSFIARRDEAWQAWMTQANCDTGNALESVKNALERLAEKLDEHDDKVDERINKCVSKRTRTRSTNSQTPQP